MTYEEIVLAWNAQADEHNQYDTLSDRERIEFALSLAGKLDKHEPVAWSRLDTARSVITENEEIKRGWELDGLPFKCLFDAPQPCPSCEVNEAIGVGNTELIEMLQAECASKQAKIDALMLEYCPDEMTAEQLVEWGEHQAPARCPECAHYVSEIIEHQAAIAILQNKKFARFHDDECWIYQGDEEDHLESLVCPVVISPRQLIDLKNKSAECEKLKADVAELEGARELNRCAIKNLKAERDEQNELLKKEQQAHLITKGKLIVREVELDRAIGTPPSQENQCSTHPDAPHGFDRTASHSLGRYVCICEGWEPSA